MKTRNIFSLITGCFTLAIATSAQEYIFRFDPESIKFQNPTEERLNDNGNFVEPQSFLAEKFKNHYQDNYELKLTLQELDSLMSLPSQPEYLIVMSQTCNPSDLEGLISLQKVRLENMAGELKNHRIKIDELKSNIGKKITSKEQEILLADILDEMIATGITVPPDAYKDLKKGKISKSLVDILNHYSNLNTLKTEFATRNLAELESPMIRRDVLYSLLRYPSFDSLPERTRQRNYSNTNTRRYWVNVRHDEVNFPLKTMCDSIPNPLRPENLRKDKKNMALLNDIKIKKSQEEFAWLDSDDFTKESESYPMPIGYRKYSSHPEFKVSDSYKDRPKGVFNSNGELIAYIIPGQMGGNPVNRNITAIYAHAYKNNAYDIQNSASSTKDYILEKAEVKFREGSLAQRTAQTRIKHIDPASLAKEDNDKMVAAIMAERKATQITKQDQLDHLKYFDRDGKNWLLQISSDWNKRLGDDSYSWTEILSPTSFSVTYFESNGTPVIRETYKYQNTTPFRIEEVKTVEIF
ncbi:MAG: hypothetical protein K2K97_06155 [Muribaculaceae bacterium]|nr:hypothetical protein [Muribaculaceae bacterium]